jgi:hypothetical protein
LTHGVFTLADARRAGLTRRQLQGTSWRRIGRETYVWAQLCQSPLLELEAIRRQLPERAAFSGTTAAWLHDLGVGKGSPAQVTAATECSFAAPRGTVVRRAQLDPADVVDVRGLPATSVLRTLRDISVELPLGDAVVAADVALHRGLTNLFELGSYVRRIAGRSGSARLRRIVALAEPLAESPMETRLRLLLVLAGLPRPEAQVTLNDDQGLFVARPDLFYRGQRLALEYDGSTHRDSIAGDNRRQNRLVEAGYTVLRFTAADVLGAGDLVVAQVKRALTSKRHLTPVTTRFV